MRKSSNPSPSPAGTTLARPDCVPLPRPWPRCSRCATPLTLGATPWPSGGTLLRWMCFSGLEPCQGDNLRTDVEVPELVPHPDAPLLITTAGLTYLLGALESLASEYNAGTKRRKNAERRMRELLQWVHAAQGPIDVPTEAADAS